MQAPLMLGLLGKLLVIRSHQKIIWTGWGSVPDLLKTLACGASTDMNFRRTL